MKKLLLVLGVAVGAGVAPTLAQAQTTPTPDTTRTQQAKPQLNTAPPGRPASPAPTPAPTRGYEVTTPAPTPAPAAPVPGVPADQPGTPVYRPNPNSPSGLEFPPGSRASEQPTPLRRYFVYANFGLGYGSYNGSGQFNASLAPAIGYRVNEKLSIGPGIAYTFNSVSFSDFDRSLGLPNSIQLHNIGLKVFAQYTVYQSFFLHAEYEVTRAQSYDIYEVIPNRQYQAVKTDRTLTTPLAGAGYRSQLSDRAAADIVVLYNFNYGYDPTGYRLSPYGQPEIRFNFLYYIGK